jgi:anaphase-promoting complex subunit 2
MDAETAVAWRSLQTLYASDDNGRAHAIHAATLCRKGFEELVRAWTLERAGQLVRRTLLDPRGALQVPRIWEQLWQFMRPGRSGGAARYAPSERRSIWCGFGGAVELARDQLRGYRVVVNAIGLVLAQQQEQGTTALERDLDAMFRALLLNSSARAFTVLARVFFGEQFKAHARECRAASAAVDAARMDDGGEEECSSGEDSNSSEEEELEAGEEDEADEVPALARSPAAMGAALAELRWLAVTEEAAMQTLYEQIDKRVQRKCGGDDFTDTLGAALGGLEGWLQRVTFPWLEQVMPAPAAGSGGGADGVAPVPAHVQRQRRLMFHLHEAFCALRIGQLFSIIAHSTREDDDEDDEEEEDVRACLDDLRRALKETQQHQLLVESLRTALRSRLLKPDAKTRTIIDVYIAMIRVLRLLDPAGVLLEAVAEPVKQYLRQRSDTVRVVITSLTGEGGLASELRRGNALLDGDAGDSDDESSGPGAQWEPDPIEADPTKTSHSRRTSDILSMLVGIYGSQDLFVQEYRNILADSLLRLNEFDTTPFYNVIEQMKLRFGDDSLTNCEIMVQDVDSSRRILTTIREKLPADTLDAKIISKHFWPSMHPDEFALHPEMEGRFDEFAKQYAVLKNPRRLEWQRGLGAVQLELELHGEMREFDAVPPLQASAIMHFQGAGTGSWTLPDLAAVLKVPEDLLRRKMGFWVNRGVLKETRDGAGGSIMFTLTTQEASGGDLNGGAIEEEESEMGGSADNQAAAAKEVYLNYIKGMCTNMGALPLERIHNMLLMFCSGDEHPYEYDESQLRAFLNDLVKEDVLECSAGEYSVKETI